MFHLTQSSKPAAPRQAGSYPQPSAFVGALVATGSALAGGAAVAFLFSLLASMPTNGALAKVVLAAAVPSMEMDAGTDSSVPSAAAVFADREWGQRHAPTEAAQAEAPAPTF